jgi:hypothetical protein
MIDPHRSLGYLKRMEEIVTNKGGGEAGDIYLFQSVEIF